MCKIKANVTHRVQIFRKQTEQKGVLCNENEKDTMGTVFSPVFLHSSHISTTLPHVMWQHCATSRLHYPGFLTVCGRSRLRGPRLGNAGEDGSFLRKLGAGSCMWLDDQ